MSEAADMTVTKRCPYCDTTLEFESGGKRFTFKAHDEAFCVIGTRGRVKMLEQVIVRQRETFEHYITAAHRRFDQIMAEAGLPSLADRQREAEAIARAMMAAMPAGGR